GAERGCPGCPPERASFLLASFRPADNGLFFSLAATTSAVSTSSSARATWAGSPAPDAHPPGPRPHLGLLRPLRRPAQRLPRPLLRRRRHVGERPLPRPRRPRRRHGLPLGRRLDRPHRTHHDPLRRGAGDRDEYADAVLVWDSASLLREGSRTPPRLR